jgi:hypothetical protein
MPALLLTESPEHLRLDQTELFGLGAGVIGA